MNADKGLIPCASCIHGERHPGADLGWACSKYLALKCRPLGAARFHEPRIVDFRNPAAGERQRRKRINLDELERLAKDGLSHTEIAEKLNCSADSVRKALRKNGHSTQDTLERRELARQGSLIRKLLEDGMSIDDVVTRTGFKRKKVRDVKRRLVHRKSISKADNA